MAAPYLSEFVAQPLNKSKKILSSKRMGIFDLFFSTQRFAWAARQIEPFALSRQALKVST
jgi:hypothetical protein